MPNPSPHSDAREASHLFSPSQSRAGGRGRGRWRKRKGVARVRLEDGAVRLAEVHWYEAHGIGRRDFKIKSYLD